METQKRTIKILGLIFLIFYVSGCWSPEKVSDTIGGPSDAEIDQAKKDVDALPDNTPEKEAARTRLDDLVASRATAEGRASFISTALNGWIPGAGAVFAGAWGLWQKSRSRKAGQERDAKEEEKKQTEVEIMTFISAIEEIKNKSKKKDDKPLSINDLLEVLATKQNEAGVRTSIRNKRVKLKGQDTKAA